MDILIIGGGGREHALAWKLQQSNLVERIYCAPGNPNITGVECIELTDLQQLADFAVSHQIGFTIAGSEEPLCAGIVDVFHRHKLPIFGPDAQAAQLEGSKSFAKDFMQRHGIPTAAHRVFQNKDEAIKHIRSRGAPVVVKADGLAAGKGVTVANTVSEAEKGVEECFSGRFGNAGKTVIVEECLRGEEASIIALVDGRTILPLASSQDHKRAGENDTGPNTGGMGAYSPAPVINDKVWSQVQKKILTPFLNGCQKDRLYFRGVIYAGVIVTDQGPKVLEFNVRFGDPETQAIMPRLQSDLAQAMLATTEQRLDEIQLRWNKQSAVCVIMAAEGYPGKYRKGDVITGIKEAEQQALIFHAGTAKNENDAVITNGGRVLGVTALGSTLPEAVKRTYSAVAAIDWPGAFYRRDIGNRGCRRLSGEEC